MMQALLALTGIGKTYGGAPALEGIDFELHRGEVHALLGENGAGKSTLTKIVAGVVRPSTGEMVLDDRPYRPATPRDAMAAGIAMVFQETSLVPSMTVAQNLWLGRERYFNRLRGIEIEARQFLQSMLFDVDPGALAGTLGAAKKQMVEIARAVLLEARVIVFDEPTATLTPEEKKHFFGLVAALRARGVTVVFITHAVEDALAISDRVTVLRDGRHVLTDSAARLDRAAVVQAMVGRSLAQTLYGRTKAVVRPPGARVLTVQNLRVAGSVRNNSFSLFAGQVTGVFGLVGSGRTETFKVVAGLMKRDVLFGGTIRLHDRPVRYRVPTRAVRDGIAYVTEDRKQEGFFETQSVGENIHLGSLVRRGARNGLVSRREALALGREWTTRLGIRSVDPAARVIELSGGNQQKVVIAKSLVQDPSVVIFDEPTRGVDVGAIADIHALIDSLADQGKAVVVISSYLPEILALSDRILVQRLGKVVEEFAPADATQESLMYAAIH